MQDSHSYERSDELIPLEAPRRNVATATLLAAAGAAAIGAGYAYDRWSTSRQLHLPEALAATRHSFDSAHAGRLSYYSDESGDPGSRPLVLLHSINAAAGAHEMRPLFDALRGTRPIYALDWPGYGFSARNPRSYTPELFAGALADFLQGVAGAPADLVALSLGSEFAARAALDNPAVASLALISPSGFNANRNATQGLVSLRPAAHAAHTFFALPFVSQALFDTITTERSIRYYLRKSFVGEPPAWLVEYAHMTTHQPGAKHVPLTFIAGLLFTPHADAQLYSPLRQPVLVIYDQDPYVNFAQLPAFLDAHPNWQAARIMPTLGLPHWEQPDQTIAALNHFWREHA